MRATLERLTGRFFEKRRPAIVVAAQNLLAAEERRASQALVRRGVVETVLASLGGALLRAAEWDVSEFRWKDLRFALRRSFRRGRQSWRQACAEPKPRRLHEWRRCVKDLHYHLSLVHSAAPDFLEEVAGELEVLGEFLGDDHDLVMLHKVLARHPGRVPAGPAREALFEMVALRREELLDAAFDLAGRIFADSPGEFSEALEERREEHRHRRKKAHRVAERLVALG
jgi:CHAD domain-containing protein